MITIHLNELTARFPQLSPLGAVIGEAASLLSACFEEGGKLLVCGNGGSSSDAGHIVAELMKGFERHRPLGAPLKSALFREGGKRGAWLAEMLQQGFPAISLAAHTALITAVANDTDASIIFAQQVVAYGKPGDILMAVSTSGNSTNILDAIIAAKAVGMKVIGLTGESGGEMRRGCDLLINVPETRTARIQELHLPVIHTLCRMVESRYLEKTNRE